MGIMGKGKSLVDFIIIDPFIFLYQLSSNYWKEYQNEKYCVKQNAICLELLNEIDDLEIKTDLRFVLNSSDNYKLREIISKYNSPLYLSNHNIQTIISYAIHKDNYYQTITK